MDILLELVEANPQHKGLESKCCVEPNHVTETIPSCSRLKKIWFILLQMCGYKIALYRYRGLETMPYCHDRSLRTIILLQWAWDDNNMIHLARGSKDGMVSPRRDIETILPRHLASKMLTWIHIIKRIWYHSTQGSRRCESSSRGLKAR